MKMESDSKPAGKSRPPRPPKPQPYVKALADFLLTHPPKTDSNVVIPNKLRYDVYDPLLLLPATSPLVSPPWSSYISSLPSFEQEDFYCSLASAFNVTHVAINQPIPTKDSADGNLIRTPQITCLHGDFGNIDEDDFRKGFWVSTTQHGIHQTWAPLYTMFSRGNITEKERICSLAKSQLSSRRTSLGNVAAVDLFVGIGYFAFSYLKAGVDTVYGWDINRWSIEGCRKGAENNKWATSVDGSSAEARLILHQESNEFAPARLAAIKDKTLQNGNKWLHIAHINLGLLPTSEPAYELAMKILALNETAEESWVHVHENVARDDTDSLKGEIIRKFYGIANDLNRSADISCDHVEFVKSWAPGVWHCVFDIRVTSRV